MAEGRAGNAHRYRWAGDPERWGAQGKAIIIVPAAGIAPRPPFVAHSEQVLRTQPEDLVAIGWDLVSTWTLENLDPGDSGVLSLEVSIGSGQTRSSLLWRLATIVAGVATTQNAGAAAFGWFPDPMLASATRQVGVALSAQPIISNALSGRARLDIQVTAAAPAHNILLSLNAHCAPRSWVP
jgi:hypothetical protein